MENSVKIAVIPARGGSKRLPRKNLLPFCGEPVISYPIRAALESDLFDRVIVSTDDGEIAERAEHFGAEVPFMRPKALADDYTGTGPVVRHAIEWLEQNGHEITATCCIYPTAVFITPELIRRGWEMLERSDYPYVFTATAFEFPIQRAVTLGPNNEATVIDRESFAKRSQDLEEAFHDAGQLYWGKGDAFRGLPLNGNSRALKVSRWLAQDIDTRDDFEFAEMLYLLNKERTCLDERCD